MAKKPQKGEYLEVILRSQQTVFSTKDVALMWGENQASTVTNRLNKYVNAGKLITVRRGFYVKDKNYNRLELATRIYTPAYISFETVLAQAGSNFQYYSNIFVASYVNREIIVDGQTITYVRMKDYVLSNIEGIKQKDNVAMATPERAALDRIYISKGYYFDNMHALNWEKMVELAPIYHNKRLSQTINEYYRDFQKNNKSI